MSPGAAVVLLSIVLGVLAGAATSRAAYRFSVPWGEPPRSGCAECRAPFEDGLLGWVRSGPRCVRCGARQGPGRWWTMPVGAAGAGLVAAACTVAWAPGAGWVLLAGLSMSGLGVLLAAIDIAVLRLPDPIVGTAALALSVLLGLAAWTGGDWSAYGRSLSAGLALLGSFGLLSLLSGGQVGLGDVKLAGVLGLLLGWFGWGVVVLGGLSSLLLNGLAALVLLAARRIGRRSALPMGPALLAGSLLALVLGQLVLRS